MNSKRPLGFLVLVILAVGVVYGIVRSREGSPAAATADMTGWQTYRNDAYGFEISYPTDWIMRDDLATATSTCCLFVAHWVTSTTTEMVSTTTASGEATTTPKTTVTSREMIKIQIGPYDKATYDPFSAGTTTEVKIGGQTFFAGESGAMQFYLLPRDEKTGVGAAVYPYLETPAADKEEAKEIISTLKLTATTP